MAKVRRIDWSPGEWLAGTRGLTITQTAVYITVLNIICDRGRPCPYDADFIGRQFTPESRQWRAVVDRALADLINMGKLIVSPDGESLTNERAELELNKARERIKLATEAGKTGGSYRKPKSPTHVELASNSRQTQQPHINNSKDLTQAPARIINLPFMNPVKPTISTDAARPTIAARAIEQQHEATQARLKYLAAAWHKKRLDGGTA